MNELLLPFPKSFSDFCSYDLYEAIPIWLDGCIEKTTKVLVYADLFEHALKVKVLDKSSIDAITEFAPSIINYKKLIKGLKLTNSDVQISSILLGYEHLTNSLKRNGIFTVNNLINFGVDNVSSLVYIGNKKYFFILYKIATHLQNTNIDDVNNIAADFGHKVDEDEIICLLNNNNSIPFDRFLSDDPRFLHIKHKIFRLIDYENLNSNDWLSIFINIANSRELSVINAIKSFKQTYDSIDVMSFEEQMDHLFRASIQGSRINHLIGDSHNYSILKNRLGIRADTKPIITLQEAGNHYNPMVTRERMRQLISKMKNALSFASEEEIYIPKLQEIKNIFEENINTNVDAVVDIIREKGYGNWCIDRLLNCFDLFYLPNNFEVDNGAITNSSFKKINNNILIIGRKISKYNGAVNLQHITKVMNKKFSYSLAERNVKKVLLIEFKELEENWFVCYKIQNILHLSHAQRLANFNNKLSLQDIREAHIKYKKHHEKAFFSEPNKTGFFGFVTPPSSVIGKVLKHFKEFYTVEDNVVYCKKPDNKFLDDTSGTDYHFLKYFQARNFDVATNDDMKKYFVIDGNFAEASFYLYLSYKPYIKRYAPKIYGIVGYEPNEDSVINAKNRIQQKLPPKIEWSNSGGINIKVRISSLSNFTFNTYGYDDYISTEEFEFKYDDEVYKARRSSGFWYGNFTKILRCRLFCEIGDFILIKLNIDQNEGEITLISENDYFA